MISTQVQTVTAGGVTNNFITENSFSANARPKRVNKILENCECVGQLSIGGHEFDCLEMTEIESRLFRECIIKESTLFASGLLRIENTGYNQGAKIENYKITVPPPKTECSGLPGVNTCDFNPETISIYKYGKEFYTKAIGGEYTLCLREFIGTEYQSWVAANVNDIVDADSFRTTDFGAIILDKIAQGFNQADRLDKYMMMSINGGSDVFANCDYGFLPKLMFASNGQYYAANKYDLSKAIDGQLITIKHGAEVIEYIVGEGAEGDGTLADILAELVSDVEGFESVDSRSYYSATYDETAGCLTVVSQFATQEIFVDLYVSDDTIDISSQCRMKYLCVPTCLQTPMLANDAPLEINYQKPSSCNFYQYMATVDNHWECYLGDNNMMEKVDWNQRKYLIDPKLMNKAKMQIKLARIKGFGLTQEAADDCLPDSLFEPFECFRNTGLFLGAFPGMMMAFSDGTLPNGRAALPNIKVRESKCKKDSLDFETLMTIGMCWEVHGMAVHNACGSPFEAKLEGHSPDQVTRNNIPCYCPSNCATKNTTATDLSATYEVTCELVGEGDEANTEVTVMILPSSDTATFTGVLNTDLGTSLQVNGMNSFTIELPGDQKGNTITINGAVNGGGVSTPLFISAPLNKQTESTKEKGK